MRFNEIITEKALSDKLPHGSSRGHMGEYLLGSAVVAKMKAGDQNISTKDAKAIINATSKKENLSAKFKGSQGDSIEFINIIKNQKNIDDARDVESLTTLMADELEGAVKFANSDIYATKYARLFAENGKPDRLVVKAAGEEDQKGTKADIFLIYKRPDGSEKQVKGWSLKTGSNLVGQASPRTFENMQEFFKELGITLKPIKNYNTDPQKHVLNIMKQVAKTLNSFTAGDNTQKEGLLIDNVSNFLNHHIAMKDPRVYIVNLGNKDYSAQTIRTMKKNLPSVDLESVFRYTKGTGGEQGRPEVAVYERGSQLLLFKIRYTYSAPRVSSSGKSLPERHRIFVETGPLFKKLSTISARDVQEEPPLSQ